MSQARANMASRSRRAGALLLVVAVLFAVAAFDIVLVEPAGPKFLTLSESRGWGLHAGDLLALVAGALASLALVVGATLCRPGRRPA